VADGRPLQRVSFQGGILSVEADSVRERFRISYVLPSGGSWWGGRLSIPTPVWLDAVQAPAPDCRWNLPEDVLPLHGQRQGRTATGRAWRLPMDDPAMAQVWWLRQSLLLL